jgi:hypothetical protein
VQASSSPAISFDNADDGSGVLTIAMQFGAVQRVTITRICLGQLKRRNKGSWAVCMSYRCIEWFLLVFLAGSSEIRVGEAWELGKTQADPGEMPAGRRTGGSAEYLQS